MSSTNSMLEIGHASRVPLHEQVAAAIRRAIAEGEARAGERLPPARDLAAVLGVNANTVLRALRTLREEGLVEFRRGRGVSVTGIAPQRSPVVAMVALARRCGVPAAGAGGTHRAGVGGAAVKAAPPGLAAGTGAESEAIIREARRRQHRRYLRTGLAIVVLAGAAGVAVSQIEPGGRLPAHQGLRHRGGPRGTSAALPGRAGVPGFFADAVTTPEGNGPLEVRSSATGALVARRVMRIAVGVSALAATGPRSFVIAEPDIAPRCGTRLYRVQLTGRGHLGGLTPMGSALPGWVASLAASTGGRVIGYAVSGCGKGKPGYLGVFDTRTGRSWAWGELNVSGNTGSVALSGPLSMSANGRLLAFTGWDLAGNWRVLGGGHFTHQVVRVLPTDAAAGSVAQRSHVVLSAPLSQPTLSAVALSPGGRSFYLCTRSARRGRTVRTITAYATASGDRQRVIATLTGAVTPTSCQMALDPSGRFLLLTSSVSPQGHPYPETAVLRLARIGLITRAVAFLRIKLPWGAGMDPPTGMNAAW